MGSCQPYIFIWMDTMIKIKMLTQWSKNENGNVPDAFRFLQSGESGMDITGEQKVDSHVINPVIVELWCGQSTLDNIIAELGNDAILSTEEVVEEKNQDDSVLIYEKDGLTVKTVPEKEIIEEKPLFEAKVFTKPSKVANVSFEAKSVEEMVDWIKARPVDK